MVKIFTFTGLVLALLAEIPDARAQTTRYVPCGTNTPCYATIQAAITASVNGDIIEVNAGTYVIPAGAQLIIDKQITLRAKAGLSAKPLIRTNLLNWSACNVQIAADNVVVDGFEIDNALYGTQAGYIVGDYGSAKNNWTVKNCNIHDGRNGLRPVGNYVTIEGNDIHGTNSDCINCEYGKCGGLKVIRNILHSEWVVSGGKPAGITYNCDGTTTGDVEISYNYCYACRTFIDFQHDGGTGPANNILIMHNTVDWKMEALPSPVPAAAIAQQMSIAFWTGSGNWDASKFTIRDNIFSRQKWYAIVNTSGSAGPIVGTLNINNNLFYQWYLVDAYYPGNAYPNEWPSARGAVGWDVTDATPSFTNDIQANPLYGATGTTPDSYYALSAGSPAHNAASDGTDIGAWQTPPVHNLTQNTGYYNIQSAIVAANSGDVIEVSAGTYNEYLSVTKPLTIQGSTSGTQPTVQFTDVATSGVTVTANNVTLKNLRFYRPGNTADAALLGVPKGGTWPNYTIDYSNLTVKKCTFEWGRYALYVHVQNMTVDSCQFLNNYRNGIILGGTKGTISILHNYIDGTVRNARNLVYITTGSGTPDIEGTININYNTSYKKVQFFIMDFWGVDLSKKIILNIKHNTIDYATSKPITFYMPPANGFTKFSSITIKDNIISNGKLGIVIDFNTTDISVLPSNGQIVVNNCLFYNNADDVSYTKHPFNSNIGWLTNGPTPAGASGNMFSLSGNLASDPLYKATGNKPDPYFTLATGSPAIGTASDATDIGAWQLPANKWMGTVSTAWNTAANWTGNTVPAEDANIVFDIAAVNHCQLDQNRSVTNITNAQSTYRMITNGFKLTVKGALNFTNGAQIDASATNSVIEFAGTAAQTIPSGSFYNNEVYGLTVNNSSNVVLSGTLRLLNTLTATTGRLDGYANSPSVNFAGTSSQTIGSNLFLSDIVYNLTISNANGVTLNTDLTINNSLTINPGALFLISPEKKLNVIGTLTNNAGSSGLVLQSNASGTASLLHHTDNVPGTVQRCISGLTEAWHFMSSPVSDQRIRGSWLPTGTYGNGTGYDLYIWHEPISNWIAKTDSVSPVNWKTVHPGTNFIAGRGYLYAVQVTNPIKSFVGNLNNGPLTFGLTTSGTNPGWIGFNMMGNPYPSSVDWQAVTGWSRTNLVSNGGGYDMWIWNPDANNYGVCNSSAGSVGTNSITRYIAPMQGYFVLASGTGSITIDNPVRVLDDTHWFKNPVQNDNTISLSVNADAGYGFDEIQLGFGYAANENGAIKLFSSVATAPSLYVSKPTKEFSVQYYTNTKQNPVVPVSFKPGVNGHFTINCNFDHSKFDSVLLEDLQTQSTQNMKATKTYSFQASTMDEANRFILHFGPENKHSGNELPARIYSDGTLLIVDLLLVPEETEVFVYDVIGRLLFSQTLIGGIQHKLDFNSDAQMLFVYLKNPNGSLCRKLLWAGK